MATPQSSGKGKRAVAVPVFIAAVLVAVLLGAAAGYFARGEPDAGSPVTVEGELPTVTVTVPQAP